MEKIILIGGGGHCKACIDVIEQQGQYHIAGIVDKNLSKQDTIMGYPVLGTDDDLPALIHSTPNAMITIGQIHNVEPRLSLYRKLIEIGYVCPSIISPLAHVAKSAKIGPGSIIMHHAIVNSEATIGENCIVNTKALVEHDVTAGGHIHIATAAVVNGGVTIADCVFIGSNSVIIQGEDIEANSFIKAGQIYQGGTCKKSSS